MIYEKEATLVASKETAASIAIAGGSDSKIGGIFIPASLNPVLEMINKRR
jgi:hypothetical protein